MTRTAGRRWCPGCRRSAWSCPRCAAAPGTTEIEIRGLLGPCLQAALSDVADSMARWRCVLLLRLPGPSPDRGAAGVDRQRRSPARHPRGACDPGTRRLVIRSGLGPRAVRLTVGRATVRRLRSGRARRRRRAADGGGGPGGRPRNSTTARQHQREHRQQQHDTRRRARSRRSVPAAAATTTRIRSSRLCPYTQVPTRPVRSPADSAPPRSQPMPWPSPSRVRTAVTVPPVRNAAAATTSAAASTARSETRRNRTSVS